jgi:hypothetical protein
MKGLLRLIGLAGVSLAILLFLYGGMKSVKAEEEGVKRINMGSDIVVVQNSEEQDRADKALSTALVTGLIGAGCLVLSGVVRKEA